MEKYCFGIDVGGTTVKCGLFTVEGDVLDKWEIKTRVEDNGVAILPDIAETIEKKLLEKVIGKDEVAGIGIGIPGPVNEKGEIPCAVNLHWGYVDIVGDMERLTGLKVKAGNDANVAALGELWQGGGTVGAHGAGGEIGHAHVEDAVTDQCNCGNCGCLEQLTSATGIVRLAKEAVAASDTPSVLRGSRISAKSVWDAVKEGDALAIQIAERFGTYLGKTLAVFATVSDPEVIVIGGGVSKAGPILLDYIMKPFRKYAFTACRDTKFALAQLGNDAGIFGAAKMVL